MANTIPVTQKPVQSSVSKDAYVLGIQDNDNGQQTLYRFPVSNVRVNGANALKGKQSGKMVVIDDVSPVKHDIECKVWSKNLLKYPYYSTTKTVNGVTITDNGDGSLTIDGTSTAGATFTLVTYRNSASILPANTTVTLKKITDTKMGVVIEIQRAQQTTNGDYIITYLGGTSDSDKSIAVGSQDILYQVYLSVRQGYTFDNLTIFPQMEFGTTASDWSRYVAPENVKIKRHGKNLCSQPSKTVSGTATYARQSLESVALSPGTYTTSMRFKQTGKLTAAATKMQKINRDENGNEVGRVDVGSLVSASTTSGNLVNTFTVTECGEYAIVVYANWSPNELEEAATCEYNFIQLEAGSEATAFETYVEPVELVPDKDGNFGIESLYPVTTFIPDDEDVTISVQYNRDINKAFERLEQAIISLGGNV